MAFISMVSSGINRRLRRPPGVNDASDPSVVPSPVDLSLAAMVIQSSVRQEGPCSLVAVMAKINNPFIIVEAEEYSLQKSLPAEQISRDILEVGKVDE